MVKFGLDDDIVEKVVIKKNNTPSEPIVFSKQYAYIGLMNFYETYPKLFMSRVSKGPPP
jgi:hypothetical protein